MNDKKVDNNNDNGVNHKSQISYKMEKMTMPNKWRMTMWKNMEQRKKQKINYGY